MTLSLLSFANQRKLSLNQTRNVAIIPFRLRGLARATLERQTEVADPPKALAPKIQGLKPKNAPPSAPAPSFSPRLVGSAALAFLRGPVLGKSLIGAAGMAAGDLIAQYAAMGASGMDPDRTCRLALFGALSGALAHLWYQFLDRVVFPQAPKSPPAVATKILLDQAAWAPLMTCLLFSWSILWETQDPTKILPTLQEKVPSTLAASYTVWPVAHAVNFSFVPSEGRVAFVNAVGVFWSVYLSSSTAGPAPNASPALSVSLPVAPQGLCLSQEIAQGVPLIAPSLTAAVCPTISSTARM